MSSIIEKLGGFAAEVRLNPHSGSIAWVGHRISGLILLLYLILHLWGLGSAAGGKAAGGKTGRGDGAFGWGRSSLTL